VAVRFPSKTVPAHIRHALKSRCTLDDGTVYAEIRYEPGRGFAVWSIAPDRKNWRRAKWVMDDDYEPRMPDNRDVEWCVGAHGEHKRNVDRNYSKWLAEQEEARKAEIHADFASDCADLRKEEQEYRSRRGDDHVHDDWRHCTHGMLLIDCATCSRESVATRAAQNAAGKAAAAHLTDRRRITPDGELKELAANVPA